MKLISYFINAFFITVITQLSVCYCQNFYDSDPNIIELTPRNFDQVVHKTNYTTLVEFYAPWCGYCQKLKNIYHKTAKHLKGIVQVVAVNCDVESNKRLCAEYNIEGFPSLLSVNPAKIELGESYKNRVPNNKHATEVYVGARKAAPMVDYMLTRIKSYVKRVNNMKKLQSAVCKGDQLNIVYISKKEKVSPIMKTIALDFLGKANFFQVCNGLLKGFADETEANRSNQKFPEITKALQKINDEQSSITSNNKKATLMVFDPKQDKYWTYTEEYLSKLAIEKYLQEHFDLVPEEGPLSKRWKFLSKLSGAIKGSTSKKNKKNHKKQKHSNDEL